MLISDADYPAYCSESATSTYPIVKFTDCKMYTTIWSAIGKGDNTYSYYVHRSL